MKRLAFIFISLLFVISGFAQTVGNTGTSVSVLDVSAGNAYYLRAIPQTDVVTSTDTLWSKVLGIDKNLDALKQYYTVDMDSVSGTPLTTVSLQGKVFWDQAWVTITSQSWAGTSADTTLIIDNSTAKHYRFYRLFHDGDGTGTFSYKITQQEVQFYK